MSTSSYNASFYIGCYDGDLTKVKKHIGDTGIDIEFGFINACYRGHLEVVVYLISKGATAYYRGLRKAIIAGHLPIVKILAPNVYSPEFNYMFFEAAKFNRESIIMFLESCHPPDYNLGLWGACQGGHLHIVKYMLSKGAFDVGRGAAYAFQYHHVDVVVYLLTILYYIPKYVRGLTEDQLYFLYKSNVTPSSRYKEHFRRLKLAEDIAQYSLGDMMFSSIINMFLSY